jgi:6-phosphofructokinase 1
VSSRIRRLGVLTSGGDSPGFNPCVRAVVRSALSVGWEPWGIRRGFAGLLRGETVPLSSRSVSGIIAYGGTILGSSRSADFATPHGLREALRTINEAGIDALVVIGGDGSQRGALALEQAGVQTIGVPGTIENDVVGTDLALGVDTALNTALDALDRIRDTASSQQQVFLIEMMGLKSGYLALMAGLAGGAEMTCVPEIPFTLEGVEREVADAYVRGKKHCIITVAQGTVPHASEIAAYLAQHQVQTGFDVRLSILGHIQRGGTPSAYDRILGTRLGAAAVDELRAGSHGLLVGIVDGQLARTPLAEATASTRAFEPDDLQLAAILAR